MKSLLFTYINSASLVSMLVLFLFFTQKMLKKYLSNSCLYVYCIILLFAYLIPFRPFAIHSVFNITIPQMNQELTEFSNVSHLDDNLSYTKYPDKILNNSITKSNNSSFYSAQNILKQQTNLYYLFIRNILYQKQFLFHLIWLFGGFIIFSYHVIKYYNFSKTLKRIMKPLDNQFILNILNQNQFKIKTSVTCYICSSIGTPITMQLLHPIIILPSYSYTKEELNYMIQHELVHIKRKDILLQWILLVCLSLHWYNPIMYLFLNLWKEFCENSCDSIVLKNASNMQRIQYSKTLLKTAFNQKQLTQLLFINFYGGKNSMKNRLQSILDTKRKKRGILTILVLITIICTTSFFSLAKEDKKNELTSSSSKKSSEILNEEDLNMDAESADDAKIKENSSSNKNSSEILNREDGENLNINAQGTDDTKMKKNSSEILNEKDGENLNINAKGTDDTKMKKNSSEILNEKDGENLNINAQSTDDASEANVYNTKMEENSSEILNEKDGENLNINAQSTDNASEANIYDTKMEENSSEILNGKDAENLNRNVEGADNASEASLDDKEIEMPQDFASVLKTYEGKNYIYGGNSPETGFDSSGFVQYIYGLYGYTLPRTMKEQSEYAAEISQENKQVGDLVFYADSQNEVSHVAIYLGDNQVIHASNDKDGVKISSIDYRAIFCMGRIFQS